MKINKISMAIIAATAVLAATPAVFAQSTNQAAGGAAAGGAGGAGGRAMRGGVTEDAIDKAVTLTDAEKPKVKAALEDYTKAVTDARNGDQGDMRTKMTAARTDLDKKLKDILTPEQYTKYQAMPRPGRRGQGGGGAGGGAGGN